MPILNEQQDPYLHFAEEERRSGKKLFSPWTTSDTALLNFTQQYFPEIPILAPTDLTKPDMTPVEILPLKYAKHIPVPEQPALFIAVGGPPAAAVALQKAQQGAAVLYVSDMDMQTAGKVPCPIWTGAANHGEPDSLTQAPAYVSGHQPLSFLIKEFFRLFSPSRYDHEVLAADYPWLSLDMLTWLKNPRLWLTGLRVFWGNYLFAREYVKSMQTGQPSALLQTMQQRTQASGTYLETLQHSLGGILREPRGSLIIASTQEHWEALQQNSALLKKEGKQLSPLSSVEAQLKYGIMPRNAVGFMEKTHDFIFQTDFLNHMLEHVKKRGGEIMTDRRLSRVFVDTERKTGGILEFYELTLEGEKKYHYRAFSHAHLSLGPTPFSPSMYDLISVTGVSINALIFGAALSGGPIVCGGSNHVVPLLPPQIIDSQEVTLVRMSAAGLVCPLDRGHDWYTYDGRHAIHLLHRVKENLPENVKIKILSVRGCNRVVGKDGRQVEIHPVVSKYICDRVTVQIGAGGGGLSQMGGCDISPLRQGEEGSS